MTHLCPEAMMDALDGVPDEATRAHLARCASCQAELSALQDTVRRTSRREDAEVSPLFWTHLSTRIAAAVSAEDPSARPWWGTVSVGVWRWPVMAGVTGAVALASWLVAGTPVHRAPATAASIPDAAIVAVGDAARVADAPIRGDDASMVKADGALGLMTDLLDADAEVSDAVVQSSGWTADDLVPALSDEERQELSRLLTRATRMAGVS